MKLLVLCLATIIAANAALIEECKKSQTIQDKMLVVAVKFDEFGLTRIIPIVPKSKLEVMFETVQVELGNCISPLKSIERPEIEYEDSDPEINYTLVIADCDVPSQEVRALSCYVVSLCVNINGTDLRSWSQSNGDPIAPYVSPYPIPGSGVHRVIALLFEQDEYINIRDPELLKWGISRLLFDFVEFAENENLGDPVAGNFWTMLLADDYEKYSNCSLIHSCCLENSCV